MIVKLNFNIEPILEEAGYTKLYGDNGWIKKDIKQKHFHIIALSD